MIAESDCLDSFPRSGWGIESGQPGTTGGYPHVALCTRLARLAIGDDHIRDLRLFPLDASVWSHAKLALDIDRG